MDDLVRQAMAKWPNVPDCFGWLGLDARGQWWMRDDRVQALGAFQEGSSAAKGSLLQHEKLIAFIERNYACNGQGWWYFQNGPQRVYIELAVTPFIWRLDDTSAVHSHTGVLAKPKACWLDETGRAYLDTDLGFGLVHTMDVPRLAKALEQGLWDCQECQFGELPKTFAFERSPQMANLKQNNKT